MEINSEHLLPGPLTRKKEELKAIALIKFNLVRGTLRNPEAKSSLGISEHKFLISKRHAT